MKVIILIVLVILFAASLIIEILNSLNDYSLKGLNIFIWNKIFRGIIWMSLGMIIYAMNTKSLFSKFDVIMAILCFFSAMRAFRTQYYYYYMPDDDD
jgi:hypothetical protein